MASATCTKCQGTGKLPMFRHVDDGVCFQCKGSGRVAAGSRASRTNAKAASMPWNAPHDFKVGDEVRVTEKHLDKMNQNVADNYRGRTGKVIRSTGMGKVRVRWALRSGPYEGHWHPSELLKTTSGDPSRRRRRR